jgi:hypothetical protein
MVVMTGKAWAPKTSCTEALWKRVDEAVAVRRQTTPWVTLADWVREALALHCRDPQEVIGPELGTGPKALHKTELPPALRLELEAALDARLARDPRVTMARFLREAVLALAVRESEKSVPAPGAKSLPGRARR